VKMNVTAGVGAQSAKLRYWLKSPNRMVVYRFWEQPKHAIQWKVKVSVPVPTVGSSPSSVLVVVQPVPTAVGINKASGRSEGVVDGDVSPENSRDVNLKTRLDEGAYTIKAEGCEASGSIRLGLKSCLKSSGGSCCKGVSRAEEERCS